MPAVDPTNSRILVTGANGYLAMWVIRTLLEQGYTVRAVVRSLEKGKHLMEYFSSYGDKVELFVVEDLIKDGSFDEAVKGVDAIEHLASPATFEPVEPDDYIKPAIQGTVGILESARNDKVKRIVITSSVVVVYNSMKEVTQMVTFDETQWGDDVIEVVKKMGRDASPWKSIAHRRLAAWEFYNQHKSEVQWDLTTLLPSFVWGPPVQILKGPQYLNESLKILWSMITDYQPDEALRRTFSLIHNRDVSAAHVVALRKETAGGERILVTNGSYIWQGIRNLIHTLKPELYTSGILPRGNPTLGTEISYQYDSEKAKRILELDYASAEKVFNDTLDYFKDRGWLEKPVRA
ncbi:D-lactaldehyde dehydrogenase [Gymnopilus junonius]|uniref:D-lactaldehyde dehydrogenase n=1 Tax=Gymnopilus junonius TaxID=109634 RepID=A0A9P5NFI6_GYMJU|nr:D-lactaldehyde dehydrogenase [Gymnopilus junonius]